MEKLKTILLHSFKPNNPSYILQVLVLDKNRYLVRIGNPSQQDTIELKGIEERNIKIKFHAGYKLESQINSIFKFKNSFGVFSHPNKVYIYNQNFDLDNEYIIVNNTYSKKSTDYNDYCRVSFADIEHKEDLLLYFGIESSSFRHFSPRYFARLNFDQKKSFFSKHKSNDFELNWEKFNELKSQYYPLPSFSMLGLTGKNWLNINSLMVKENLIHIHTNGGERTRLKNGPNHEISILSILTQSNKLIKNYNIEKGRGHFSADKKYFLLHPEKSKNKLYIYNTINYNLEFEISLTKKQNINDENTYYLNFDLIEDILFIYNAQFLNIAKIIYKK